MAKVIPLEVRKFKNDGERIHELLSTLQEIKKICYEWEDSTDIILAVQTLSKDVISKFEEDIMWFTADKKNKV